MIEGKKVYLMVVTIFLMLLFTACGSKSRQTEPFVHDDNPIVEQVEPDTVTSAVQKEEPKVEEKPSVPTVKQVTDPVSHIHSFQQQSYMILLTYHCL